RHRGGSPRSDREPPRRRLRRRGRTQPVHPPHRPGMFMTPPALLTRDLRVDLDDTPVLRGLTMTVRAGEAVAIMGENGSGKSTLLRSLLALVPIRGGHAEIFGRPVTAPRSLPWKRIGYVPQ